VIAIALLLYQFLLHDLRNCSGRSLQPARAVTPSPLAMTMSPPATTSPVTSFQIPVTRLQCHGGARCCTGHWSDVPWCRASRCSVSS